MSTHNNNNNNNLKQHRVDTGNDPAYDLVNENWNDEHLENSNNNNNNNNNNNHSEGATLFFDAIPNDNALSFSIANDSSKLIHFGSKLVKFSSSPYEEQSVDQTSNVVSSIKMAIPILSNFFSSSTSSLTSFCLAKMNSAPSTMCFLPSSTTKTSSSLSNTPPALLTLSSVVKKLRSEILPSCNFHVPLTPMLIGLGSNPTKISQASSTASMIEKSPSRPRRSASSNSVSTSNNNNNHHNTNKFLMMTTSMREKLDEEDLWWWLKSDSGCPRHGPFACTCRNWAAEAFLLFGLSCEVHLWNLEIRLVGDENSKKDKDGAISSSLKLKRNNSRKAQQQQQQQRNNINNDTINENSFNNQKSSRRFDADAIDQRKMKKGGDEGDDHLNSVLTASSSSQQQKPTLEQQVQEMKITISERIDQTFEAFFFMKSELANESFLSSFVPVITFIIGQDVPEAVTENSVFDANEKYLSEKIIEKLREERAEETHLPPIVLVCITADSNINNKNDETKKKSTVSLFYLVDESKKMSGTVAEFFSFPSATTDQIRYVKYSARILSQQPNNNNIQNDKQIQDIIESLQEGLTSSRDFYHHYFSSNLLWGKIVNKNKNYFSASSTNSNSLTTPSQNQDHLTSSSSSSSASSLLLRRCSWCNLLCARQWVGKVPQQLHRICVDCDRVLCGCPQTGCNHRCVRCGRAVCGMCCQVEENVDGIVLDDDGDNASMKRNERREDSCFGLFEVRVCRTCGEK